MSTDYIVRVVDDVDDRLTGHHGRSYTSPPQTRDSALELVRVLMSCDEPTSDGPWQMAIAGGRRTITLAPADGDGEEQ